MLKFTKDKMTEYTQQLEAGTARAQCYNIANLEVGHDRTIAEAMASDHNSLDGALRAAQLMVSAGCAKEVNAKSHCFGTFVFEDNSELK